MNIWQIRTKIFAATLSAALCGATLYSQTATPPQSPRYDPKTETTVNGIIQEVKEVPGPGRSTGTHLVVKAGDELVAVHVGPTWYLQQVKCDLQKDAQVEILGSKVVFEGKDVVLARQIKEGGNEWTLRNAQGIPAWSKGQNR
ncbi:MAG TPA: hypothetical protein VL128_17095 [Candidatus Eisenbacteria bacterium]|nr:hypothetical protein [Candidatus Eisenbacteria bacterium]